MKVPNKIVPFKNSIFSSMLVIIEIIKIKEISLIELYKKTQKKFNDIDDFLLVLNLMYVMEKIIVKGEYIYVNRITM